MREFLSGRRHQHPPCPATTRTIGSWYHGHASGLPMPCVNERDASKGIEKQQPRALRRQGPSSAESHIGSSAAGLRRMQGVADLRVEICDGCD